MAKNPSADKRLIGRNDNTPVDILKALSKDKNPEVRSSLLTNLKTPYATLLELAKDKDIDFLAFLDRTPYCAQVYKKGESTAETYKKADALTPVGRYPDLIKVLEKNPAYVEWKIK